MNAKMEIFNKLYQVDFKGKIERKGKFSYVSWASAWAELQKVCPEVLYEIVKFNDLPYKQNEKGECIVFTKMTINSITHEMWLPVMDFKNQASKNPSMMDINKTIMRCLVKNMAMFGLGLKVYEGEDLPEEEPKQTLNTQKPVKTLNYEELKEELLGSGTRGEMQLALERARINAKHLTFKQGQEIKNIKECLEKQFEEIENA